jgi:hypothetical protein
LNAHPAGWFLSSFDHIRDSFYESSEMHGKDALDIQYWIRETKWDDERRFQYLKSARHWQMQYDLGKRLKILKIFEL